MSSLFIPSSLNILLRYYYYYCHIFQELGLYYDGNSGTYYYYDDRSRAFQFHSQVEAAHQTVPTSTAGVKYEEHENRRRNKHKDSKVSDRIFIFSHYLSCMFEAICKLYRT
jgi:hypothetical protein